MKSYRRILLFISFLLSSYLSIAQEICDNGVDDDGDGLIDCYDPDCSGNDACSGFYIGNPVICGEEPDASAFSIQLQWASDNYTAFNSITPAVGDLDGDGIPEVVTTNRHERKLFVLDGATGNTKGEYDLKDYEPYKSVAIGYVNKDKDGNALDESAVSIFVKSFSGRIIERFIYNADDNKIEELWSESYSSVNQINDISLADFNGDGVVELLHGNQIINAENGDVLVDGVGSFKTEVPFGTIAIDLLGDSDLEILAGGEVYSVDIAAGTASVVRRINDILPADGQYGIRYSSWGRNFNFSSIADYNEDGNIDAIFAGGQYVFGTFTTSIFFWDIANNEYKVFNTPENHVHGAGRINIADIDGDGLLECTFVSKQRLYAIDDYKNVSGNNLQLISGWNGGKGYKDIQEGSSGFTGCTVFDFNGDKAAEIVYRGERYVHIIDGKTGNSLNTIACTSRTYDDYPVVADVDGDGATEICVSCSFDNNTPFSPYSNGKYGHIRVFEAGGGEVWQPSRTVWNQHAYFNVNINDDLSIPKIQQNITAEYNGCNDEGVTPLNAFLNQAPFLDQDGCLSFASPNLELVSITDVGNAQCPEGSFNVTVNIQNVGDMNLTGLLPITFYNGSPFESGSQPLNTVVTTLTNFDVGESLSIVCEVIGEGGDYDLYVSLNDAGGITPPISSEESINRQLPECLFSENIDFTNVTADPFEIVVDINSDDERCENTFPANGDANAYFLGTISATSEVIWSENFEDLADGTEEDTGVTAWSFTTAPSKADNLEVSFTGANNELWFNDVDGVAVWESEVIDISTAEEIQLSISLRSSARYNDNGDEKIEAYYRVDSDPEQRWASEKFDFGSTTASATGITGSSLVIIIKANNNDNREFYYADDIVVTKITNKISGEITAGFDFNWFQNNNFNDTLRKGNRFADLPAGTYQVVASSQDNSCISEIEEIIIEEVEEDFEIEIDVINQLTDCSSPNGELHAFVVKNGVRTQTGYDFTWYLGSTQVSSIAVGPEVENLAQGEYNVAAISETSGCEKFKVGNVTTAISVPVASLVNVVHITDCTDPNSGSIQVEGDEANSKYFFNWYHGTEVKPTPDWFASGNAGAGDSGETYKNLEAGFYTVRLEHKNTGCLSDPLVVEVLDNSGAPEINVDIVNNQSCNDVGSGSATAEIAGASINDYSFSFYNGFNTLSTNLISTTSGTSGETALLLTGGDYTVVATENTTNCTSRKFFTITDNLSYPSLPASPLDNIVITNVTTCDGVAAGQGSIDASGLPLASVNTSEFETIVNGSFEVPVITTVPGCTGCPGWTYLDQSLALGWSTTNPSGNLEYWASGNGGVPAVEGNQFAEINSDGFGAFYFDITTKPEVRMVWSFSHRGRAGTDRIALRIDEPSASSPIVITEESTGNSDWAEYSGTYTIPDGQTATRFSFEAISAAGSSTIGNFLDNIVFEVAPYYYQLYSGNNTTGTLVGENTTGTFNGLDAGTYTLSIVNNVTGCPTDDLVLVIQTAEEAPIIVRQTKTSDSFCENGDGTQRITFSTDTNVGEPVAGYDVALYAGTTATGTPIETVSGNSGDYTFANLADGDYTALVTNNDNSCSNTTQFTILDISDPRSLGSPTTSPQSNCTGTPNGFAAISVFGGGNEDFLWTWLDASDTPIPGKIAVDFDIDGTANNLTDVAAGTYKVFVKEKTTGCISPIETVVIPFEKESVDINLSELASNTSCNIGNGELGASVGALAEVDDYIFEWYVGTDTELPAVPLAVGDDAGNNSNVGFRGTNNSEIFGLTQGTYSLKVTSNASGCSNTSSITLSSTPILPVINEGAGDVTVTGVTSCGGSNGTITLNNIETGGAFTSTSDYTYTWYEGASNTGVVLSETSNSISGLASGDYSVEATNKVTLCTSAFITVNVGEVSPNYTITPTNKVDQTVCDLTSFDPTGGITLDIASDAATQTAGFSFKLFNGHSTADIDEIDPASTIVNFTLSSPGVSSGNDRIVITGLNTGTYRVQFKDEDTECLATQDFTIIENTVSPVINQTTLDAAANNNTTCDVANPNGSVDATTAISSGSSPYSYIWYEGGAVGGTQVATTANATGLAAGQYTVEVTDAVGCKANATVTIGETLPVVASASSAKTDQTVCDLTSLDPTGGITIDASTSTGASTAGYAFKFFNGLSTADVDELTIAAPIAVTVSATGVGSATNDDRAVISGLNVGTYTVLITDLDNQCTTFESFTIIENTVSPVINQTTLDAAANNNTTCDVANPNGSVDATTAISSGSTPYSYIWYEGGAVGGTQVATNANATGLAAGQYTVEVTDAVGCKANATVTIGETLPVVASTSSAKTDQTVCDLTSLDPTGGITIDASTSTGASTAGYTFKFFNGLSTADVDELTIAAPIAVTVSATGVGSATNDDRVVISGLNVGTYTVLITDLDNQCTTFESFTIIENTVSPVINQTTLDAAANNNTTCDVANPNGSVDATTAISSGSTPYSYIWYEGGAVGGTQVATTANATGLAAGQYTVEVTDAVGCKANATVTIGETLPTISAGAFNKIDQTVCDIVTYAPTGSISFDPSTSSGSSSTGYSFAFFEGSNTDVALTINPPIAVSIDDSGSGADPTFNDRAVISGLTKGTYTVLITDLSNTCSIEETFIIEEDLTNVPTINVASVTEVDNTVCEGGTDYPNGSIDASTAVASGTSPYSYVWYYGTSTSGIVINDGDDLSLIINGFDAPNHVDLTTANAPDNLISGDYTVVVTDSKGCESEVYTFNIDDSPTLHTPSITIQVEQLSCNPATPTGQLLADADGLGTTTGYSFKWFEGNTTAPANEITPTQVSGNDFNVTGLLNGVYTVEVTNTSTGCIATNMITIGETIATVSAVATPTEMKVLCKTADGSISVVPSTSGTGVGYSNTGYTYVWYFGNTEDTDSLISNGSKRYYGDDALLSAGGSTLSQISAGEYLVVVTDNTTGCAASAQSVVVPDMTTANPISITELTTPTDCADQGGSLLATVSGANGPFTFEWYEGSVDYAAMDDQTDELVDGTSIPNNGTVALNISNTSATTNTISNLTSYIYTVVVENANGCRYQATYDLGYATQKVTTAITVFPATECNDFNGSAEVGIENDVYNDEWNVGSYTNGTSFDIGETVTGGASGYSAVVITASPLVFNFSNQAEVFVAGEILTGSNGGPSFTTAIVDLATPTNAIIDDADDINNYDIFLFVGDGVPSDRSVFFSKIDGASVASGSEVNFTLLPPGTYTAVAQEKSGLVSGNDCWTASATETVLQYGYDPILSSATIINDNTYCNASGPYNGSITVEAGNDGADTGDATYQPGTGFRFTWYTGSDDSSPISGFENIDVISSPAVNTLTGRPAGTYSVKIERLGLAGDAPNGCFIFNTYEIINDYQVIALSNGTPSPNTNCDTPDGSITIADADIADGDIDEYRFDLYKGGTNVGDKILDNQTTALASIVFSGLEEDTYYIEAENILSGCTSSLLEVIIDRSSLDPTLEITSSANDITCLSGIEGNGNITVSVSDGVGGYEPTSDYNYRWFTGTGVNIANLISNAGTISGADTETISGISGGTYTVEVEEISSNCTNEITYTIQTNEQVLTAIVTKNQDNQTCDGNGELELTDVLVNGVSSGITGYTIEWDDDINFTSIDGTGAVFSSLVHDTYYVRVKGSGCTSGVTSTEVEDKIDRTAPELVATVNSLDLACTGGTPTGGATVTASGGVGPYTYQWYTEDTYTTTLSSANGGNNHTIFNVAAADYFVRVTDTGAPVGCTITSDLEVVIGSGDTDIVATTGVTHQTDCSPNGEVELTTVSINGTNITPLTELTISWYENADKTGAISNGANIADLDAGTYYAFVTDDTRTNPTACISEAIPVTIEDNVDRTAPELFATVNSLDLACTGGTPTGGATVTASGGSGSYTYQWYTEDTYTTTLSSANGGNNHTIFNVAAASYFVRVTDTGAPAGCNITSQLEVVIGSGDTDIVAVISSVDQQNCTPSNSNVEISTVTINGADQTGNVGITWYANADKSGGALSTTPLYSGIEAGTYYAYIEDNTRVGNTACTSEVIAVTIDDVTVKPNIEVDIVNSQDNTWCDTTGESGDGILAVSITGGIVNDYEFTWYRGDKVDAGNNISDGSASGTATVSGGVNDERIENLSPGKYTVVVRDNNAVDFNFDCSTTATFEVISVPAIHSLDSTNIANNIIHVVDCGAAANGQITISNADVTSANVADYTFTWYTNNPLTEIVGETSATISGLTAQSYVVEATNTTTGCTTDQIRFEIEDNSVNPTVDLTIIDLDSSCKLGDEGNGVIEWEITSPKVNNFSYQWYAGNNVASGTPLTNGAIIGGTTGSASPVYNGQLSGVNAGYYTIRVIDETSDNRTCFVDATVKLEEDLKDYTIATGGGIAVPNEMCTAPFSGEYEVSNISVDGTPQAGITGFTMAFSKPDGSAHGGTDDANGQVSALEPGLYQVTLTNDATECESIPFDFEIEDDATAPELNFILDQPDQYCTGGNGELTANTDAGTPVYDWSTGATSAQITDLDQGTYSITVTDNDTRCEVSGSYTVPLEPIDVTVDPDSDIDITENTFCVSPNGIIEITGINPNALADYEYILHTGTFVASGGTNKGNNPVISGLNSGEYFVEILHTETDCKYDPIQLTVPDATKFPVLELTDFDLQTDCGGTPNGSLTVNVLEEDGSYSDDTNVNYNFQWTGGPNADTYTGLTATDMLDRGTWYNISVTNNITGCITNEAYGMEDGEDNVIGISVSTSGDEYCDRDNGIIVINIAHTDEEGKAIPVTPVYYISEGTTPPDYIAANELPSNTKDGVAANKQYTIQVYDEITECSSDPVTVTIDDDTNTMDMMMDIVQDFPYTKCDPSLADGQATVSSVPDEPSRYNYEWYFGSTSEEFIGTGFTQHNLIGGTYINTGNRYYYTVKMMDRYTGCIVTDTIQIDYEKTIVPIPDVELVSDLINCRVDNGEVKATIDNEVSGYIFEWRSSADANSTTNFIDYGSVLDSLSVGKYYVNAFDVNSGCKSEADSIEVADARVIPEFEVDVVDHKCAPDLKEFDVENGATGFTGYVGSGEADLFYTTSASIDQFYWWETADTTNITSLNTENVISRDERLSGLMAGSYYVKIVDENDCEFESDFEVRSDVTIYNGISANGDGQNEYFRISCAGDFPNNSVKIYNRSGTLVYETRGYEDPIYDIDAAGKNVFTGTANKGVGGSGDLPSGTYFYIFDKGDGSDIYQGYLELVR
ncbi:gliding motility-associated C-terminal domain-containing protein [Reichenbachiella versicolor]|uniref:gliding motility-associated C-terminal domain-containing protein n=1 Tax=Reichenbachiella versicolor TaxID=1821036 RepID=UPI000D6E57C5|nr:gliding motility-associated C-terminal domain-containing protein [Reichenbachiella versicolor]